MSSQQKVPTLIFPLKLNFSAIAITISVIFLTFPASNGSDGSFKECSHLGSCGNISNIGYPFWGHGLRSKYCGNPAFELKSCSPKDGGPDYPILHSNLSNDPSYRSTYQVLAINNHNKTIELLPLRPDTKRHCLIPSSQSGVAHTHFVYSTKVKNISICCHCNNDDMAGGKNSVKCSDDQGKINATYCRQNVQNMGKPNEYCTPMQVQLLEVNYYKEYLRHCSHCERSSGACGWSYSSSTFMCFRKSGKRKLILEIAIPVGISILIAITIGVFWCKKQSCCLKTLLSRTTSYDRMRSDLEFGSLFFGIPVFSYTEIQEATNNFDLACELGEGSSGVVYHGQLIDGREVAVKRLHEKNYKRVGRFMNEVEILTKVSHPNLVTLYGCTSRELLLVYEYIPNGTVADHLYGDKSKPGSLTWTIRMKIAVQTAGALSYLLASDIIHRDVKTSNILLDSDFTVKEADFGISRFFPFDATHVSTAPQGTPGYLDPEYDKCYQVTKKSDVYSFGVVLIELISSLPAIDVNRDGYEINLSTYAMNKIRQGALHELVDHKLGFKSDFKVKRMVTLVAELAFQCLQQEKEIRPSMEEVFEALKRIESIDYEALEAEEVSRGSQISKPASEAEDGKVEQPLRDT